MQTQNDKKEVPMTIKRWNWGAFFFGFIWGIFHRVWISLLVFIPPLTIIMPFVLGAKGNEWAWQKSNINDVDEFLKSQRKWSIAAGIFLLGILAIFISTLSWNIYDYNYGSSRDRIMNLINNNQSVDNIFGRPIEKNSFMNFNSHTKRLNNGKYVTFEKIDVNVKGTKTKGNIKLESLTNEHEPALIILLKIKSDNQNEQVTIIDETQNDKIRTILQEFKDKEFSSDPE